MKTTYKIKQLIEQLHSELEKEYGYDYTVRIAACGYALDQGNSFNRTVKPETDEPKPINFERINNDVNGNPRYVVHFLECIPDKFKEDKNRYELTVKLMNKIGGRKYHNKSYGGGIVFSSYCLQELEQNINKLKKESKK